MLVTAMRTQLLELKFSADPKRLKMVRDHVQQAASKAAVTKKAISDLIIAVNEACMNVMEHAYKGDRSGEIVLEMNNHDDAIEVVITDFAPPVDYREIQPRALDELRPGGLGTFFIRELMDEWAYAHLKGRPGNVLRMVKRLRGDYSEFDQ